MTTTKWIKFADEQPRENGEYLVYFKWKRVSLLPFYIETGKWNQPQNNDKDTSIPDIEYWAELPNTPHEAEGNEAAT